MTLNSVCDITHPNICSSLKKYKVVVVVVVVIVVLFFRRYWYVLALSSFLSYHVSVWSQSHYQYTVVLTKLLLLIVAVMTTTLSRQVTFRITLSSQNVAQRLRLTAGRCEKNRSRCCASLFFSSSQTTRRYFQR